MTEHDDGKEGFRVILDRDAKVFQRVRPTSPAVFFVSGLSAGTQVDIGNSEEVRPFDYEQERLRFVPWKDSGEKELQYLRVDELPPMVKLALSPLGE